MKSYLLQLTTATQISLGDQGHHPRQHETCLLCIGSHENHKCPGSSLNFHCNDTFLHSLVEELLKAYRRHFLCTTVSSSRLTFHATHSTVSSYALTSTSLRRCRQPFTSILLCMFLASLISLTPQNRMSLGTFSVFRQIFRYMIHVA